MVTNCSERADDHNEITVPAVGEWHVRFSADSRGTSEDFDETEVPAVKSRAGEPATPHRPTA
jgi:hypothetical protein